jgi:hypothetical protein
MAYLYIKKPIAEKAEASKNWPSVEALITKSKLDTSRDSRRKGNLLSQNLILLYD